MGVQTQDFVQTLSICGLWVSSPVKRESWTKIPSSIDVLRFYCRHLQEGCRKDLYHLPIARLGLTRLWDRIIPGVMWGKLGLLIPKWKLISSESGFWKCSVVEINQAGAFFAEWPLLYVLVNSAFKIIRTQPVGCSSHLDSESLESLGRPWLHAQLDRGLNKVISSISVSLFPIPHAHLVFVCWLHFQKGFLTYWQKWLQKRHWLALLPPLDQLSWTGTNSTSIILRNKGGILKWDWHGQICALGRWSLVEE